MTQAIDELLGAVTSVVNASVEQTTASQALAQEVAGKMGAIDERMNAAEVDFQNWKINSGFVPQRDNLMAMPLNKNAFLHDLGNGPLDGWGTRGSVVIEAVHPFTKGFEGPYLLEKPINSSNSIDTATSESPYYYGRWNKGPRIRRGGIADGWAAAPGGHILRIYKPEGVQHRHANSCMFSVIESYKRNRNRFRAYVYVSKGPLSFDFGSTDDGGQINIPSEKEWHFIDQLVYQSEVCSNYMNINIDHADECEIYIALINILAVEGAGNNATIINRGER